MSACAPLVFNNVDAPKFDCVSKAVAAQVGIPISGNAGTQSKSGYTVRWNYNPTQLSLTIQCMDSPFGVPCTMINSKISNLVSACGVK
jgi:hypothetical protein